MEQALLAQQGGGAAPGDRVQLLRFATAGSVDDGKSTLIGRLLHDAKALFADQLDAVARTSQRRGDDRVDLSLLTDGLRAEREQGITIDVAYRSFATPRRRFIIADTPGHVQYTRNMVTGASTADLALVLVDARRGVTEQSRRHLSLAALLRVPHLVVCVNKMDLVDWSERRFDEITAELEGFAANLEVPEPTFVPVSALTGDNVVEPSVAMAWYQGPTLLHHLEQVEVLPPQGSVETGWRFPVQYVIRPRSDQHRDYRGYAGQLAAGVLQVGDEVVALPSGVTTTVAGLDSPDGPLAEAFPPMSVTVRLADDLDLGRGDVLAGPSDLPDVGDEVEAMVCWFSEHRPLTPGARYAVKHTTRRARAVVQEIAYRLDVNSQQHEPAERLGLNEIGRVRLRTTTPLVFDSYRRNRTTGSFILIDEASGDTVAAGMIDPA